MAKRGAEGTANRNYVNSERSGNAFPIHLKDQGGRRRK